ncbi:MBL fold metallo-hydrolase RNA specificity domain-containing protein [Vibrio mediterranei]|uniref:MBL fold metallo-hydrolase RNA specificity domain-containing protein n=1 Tax=Vibrio mediterranei TaxID=689 RepID=UPI001EFE8305|nr:MBL fold metallo-hydrolase [Vibrio mediterranei]MCG9659166.1 MBL fold metallo-hydrolase [Vibrio mediterranei]
MHLTDDVYVIHHGGKNTVTGSCHELKIGNHSLLIDCGMFQGRDARDNTLDINFSLRAVRALVLTHSHIDHIGRLPWLFAAGFRGPVYCTQATAHLMPLMLEDGLKLQFGMSQIQRTRLLTLIKRHTKPVRYDEWVPIKSVDKRYFSYIRFQPAGHILGSAYVEVKLPNSEVVVFSGDLGPDNTPLLPDPKPPKRADYLFLESTYGDNNHEDVKTRSRRLLEIIQRSVSDGGVILIPSFSVGRTQELLFDIEMLLSQHQLSERLPIIIDSPLAAKVTNTYRRYRKLWSKEAQEKVLLGRRPLSFDQCIVVESHHEHTKIVNRLRVIGEPAIVIAASGMCQGGRIVNYLHALLSDKRTDVVFCGYQAAGTLGRDIQAGRPFVIIDEQRVKVNAKVHSMSGYSAHADQQDLLTFVAGCSSRLKQVHLIHGETSGKTELVDRLRQNAPLVSVIY